MYLPAMYCSYIEDHEICVWFCVCVTERLTEREIETVNGNIYIYVLAPIEIGHIFMNSTDVLLYLSLMAAAGTGSLWQCRSPLGHSAGTQKWAGPRACSSSTPA